MSAIVIGVGQATPEHIMKNSDFTEFMETSDEWIVSRSGIRERHWVRFGAEELTNSDLAAKAARGALNHAGIPPEDLDLIIYVTISADQEFPGGGGALLGKLEIKKSVPVIEVRNHCSGFLYGLHVANSMIISQIAGKVLVVGCEVQSTGLNLSNAGRNTAVLFGDGAGAFVLTGSDGSERGILATYLASDGSFAEKLGVAAPGFARTVAITAEDFEGDEPAAYPRMDGKLVFKMASLKMPEAIKMVLEKAGFQLSDLSMVIPHQANERILEMLRAELGGDIPVFSNIAKYGNTTGASIPLAFSEAVSAGAINSGDLICFASFGAGFAWGAILLRW